MVFFGIIATYANKNIFMYTIAEKLYKIKFDFSFIEMLRGYHLDLKLTKDQKEAVFKALDINSLVN